MKTATLCAIALASVMAACSPGRPADPQLLDRTPDIYPDFGGATLPANIAAPTFMIGEEAESYFTEIGAVGREPAITVGSRSAVVIPPLDSWHALLAETAGDSIYVRVSLTRHGGRAEQMADIICPVSADTIDSYLVYRLLYPGYELWNEIGIYQRDLTSYTREPVIENKDIDTQCVNCHSFAGNSPETMMIHVRGAQGGTLLRRDGATVKVNPKCEELPNGATYPSWHPSGKFIAFSANNIQQFFHSHGTKTIEVVDLDADMSVYDVERGEAITDPRLSGDEWIETFPTWSPDGQTLYFCRARSYTSREALDSVRYDLCRVGFDPAARTFGDPEVIVAAAADGKSVSFPRVSPDGRWLLFTLSDYGNFSIWHPESDLWLLDLTDLTARPVDEINSDDVDSYHSWSANGKWVTFSSKRMDGLWARPFIASFDPATGRFGTPFVVPQDDPLFYDGFMKTYNIPELVSRKITATGDFVSAVKK